MPSLTETRNQINGLESGLKRLRQSRMMRQSEFKDMYSAIEQHHRDVRLAHLTGKPKDIMQQNEQDTRFYFILTKMLNEIQVPQGCQPSGRDQKDGLQQVYAWYQGNRHVLHSGPRFGRNKLAASKAGPKSILKHGFGQMQRQSQSAQRAVTQVSAEPDPIFPGSTQSLDNPHRLPSGGQPELHVGDPESTAISNVAHAQMVSPPPERPQAPTPNKGLGVHRTESLEHLLPKRKPYHPLSHLYNPHAHDIEAENTGSLTEAISSPVRLQVAPKELAAHGQGGNSEYKTEHMRRWDAFQQEQGYGQDMLSKLQHVGRSGFPQGVRYSAHEKGLMPEDFTDDVIASFAHVDDRKKGTSPRATKGSDLLGKQELEDFYEFTEDHYPQKLPKYPSFKSRTNRTKSAPPGGRNAPPGAAPSKRAVSAKQAPGKRCPSATSRASGVTDSGVKLDTVVGLIDTVTDELSYHREKLAPNPQPGYRQPAVGMTPSPDGDRPQTSPATVVAHPPSPTWQDYIKEEHLEYEADEGGAHALPTHPAAMEVIDWRGRVLPGAGQHKWKKGALGQHSYVQKMNHSRSSLRTAGSTRAGTRPKTAPVPPKERWSSETPSEMDEAATSEMMQVQHLGGSSRRNRRRFYYDYLGPDRTGDTRPSTTPSPGMEYLSFIAPKMMSGNRASTAPGSEMYFEGLAPNQSPSLDGPQPFLVGGLPRDNDSMSGDIDVPDMHDLDDDLDDLGDNFNEEENSERAISEDSMTISRSSEGHAEPEGADPHQSTTELLSDIHSLLQDQGTEPQDTEEQPEINSTDDKQCVNVGEMAEDSPRPSSVKKSKPHVVFAEDYMYDQERMRHNSPAQSLSPSLSPCVSPRLITATHGAIGLHLSGKQPGGVTGPGSRAIVKPRSAPGGSRYISQSEHFPLMQPQELDLDPFNLGDSLHPRDSDSVTGGGSSVTMPSPRQKQRLHVRAFPVSKPASNPEQHDTLSIQGMGRVQGKPRQPVTQKPRARSAGSVPARAKSASHKRVLLRQQEMLRRSPAVAYHTSPSIPSPYNQHGGRPGGSAQAYSAEMESHARKDRSPRHFMQKIGVLRQGNDGVYGPPYDADGDYDDPPLNCSIRVVRLKFGPGAKKQALPPSQPELPTCDTPDNSEDTPSETRRPPDGQDSPCPKPRPVSGKRFVDIGRPIPDYGQAIDPDDYAAAVQLQKEAAAAVDIQRLFRGYVARNHYRYLQKEEREKREDRRKAAVEIQRAFRGHQSRKRAIYSRTPDPETVAWAREYKTARTVLQEHRDDKAETVARQNARNKAKADDKLAVIGPHVEVYDGFHPKKVGPDKSLLIKAAIVLQKYARRWLVSLMLARLKRKGKQQAGSWPRMVSQYKDLIRRIQMRRGVERPVVPFNYTDMNDFMDTKRRYESVFERKAFGAELDIDELATYFKECDLYPAKSEINEAMDLVMKGREVKPGRGLQRHDVLDITYQLYPPKGSGIRMNRQSTWMNPIIDGEEAVRLLGTDGVEDTDFKTCWKMTSDSHRARTERERQQRELQKEEEELAAEQMKRRLERQSKAAALAAEAAAVAETELEHEEGLMEERRELDLQAMVLERRQSRSSLRISELHDILEVEEEAGRDTNRSAAGDDGQKVAQEQLEE